MMNGVISTMYKVLIVEDERVIRQGMLNHPIWSELGLDCVLEADDGSSGIEMMQREPDIRLVISDIRMAKMSGMAFIQALYEQMEFKGKVIIISGYDDFQYARQAMTYGVIDFLLKPVDMDELKEVVKKAIVILEQEEKQQHSLSMMDYVVPKLKERVLQGLIHPTQNLQSEQRVMELLHQYGFDWLSTDTLFMLVLEVDNLKVRVQAGDPVNEKEVIAFAVGNVLEYSLLEQSEMASKQVSFSAAKDDKWVVIFGANGHPASSFSAWAVEFRSLLIARMAKYVRVNVSVALSAAGSFETLNARYEEALTNLMHSKLYGSMAMDQEGNGQFRDVDLLLDLKALTDLLKHGEERDVREAMASFPAMVQEWGVTQLRDLHHRVFEWLLELFEEARKLGWKQEEWKKKPLSVWDKLEAFDTLEALQPQVLLYLLQINKDLSGKSQNQLIHQAERYIQQHYKQSITIQSVADSLFITPEWLSTLFKKNFGTTFLDYVTHLRMEEARLLLQDISLKIYQISHEVGYKDTVYFSRLFKKKYGYTPKDYRNLRGIQADD
jgi:two-component system response regulator YesN